MPPGPLSRSAICVSSAPVADQPSGGSLAGLAVGRQPAAAAVEELGRCWCRMLHLIRRWCRNGMDQRDAALVRRRPGAVACDELPWREVHEVVGGKLISGGGDQKPRARASLVVQ